jgi:hypothetical protein
MSVLVCGAVSLVRHSTTSIQASKTKRKVSMVPPAAMADGRGVLGNGTGPGDTVRARVVLNWRS